MTAFGIARQAGTVRGRLLASHRLGREEARGLACEPSLDAALERLRATPYGHDVDPQMTLAEAQRAVAATALWQVRVLAGWLPPSGGETMRVLAGWWEILAIEDHVAGLSGAPVGPPFELGALATAWPRIAEAATPAQVRAVLAASPWGAPYGDGLAELGVALRLAWARRVAARLPAATPWAAAWAALVVARDLFAGARVLPAAGVTRSADLGLAWAGATTVTALAEGLPREVRWVLDDVTAPEELWRGEARWWARLDAAASERLRRTAPTADHAAAVVAALGVDAWRVQAALEIAARGGREVEALDVVA